MKFRTAFTLMEKEDVDIYAPPATEENMKNVARLFANGIKDVEKKRVRHKPKLIRTALATVMTLAVGQLPYLQRDSCRQPNG